MQAGTQKITAHLPKALLKEAQQTTGLGITETIKAGLEILAKQRAFEELRSMRAKVKLHLDHEDLRKDRGEQ
jgi:hypothetical protein